jgi:hypothetical protein
MGEEKNKKKKKKKKSFPKRQCEMGGKRQGRYKVDGSSREGAPPLLKAVWWAEWSEKALARWPERRARLVDAGSGDGGEYGVWPWVWVAVAVVARKLMAMQAPRGAASGLWCGWASLDPTTRPERNKDENSRGTRTGTARPCGLESGRTGMKVEYGAGRLLLGVKS